MALARVVSFDEVSDERMAELARRINESERPEGMPATELLVLHDPEAQKSLVVMFFENEDDFRKGDEIMSAMPSDDTPGKRAGVTKYQVAARMTA